MINIEEAAMKASSMNTHMGNISIDNEVIAQYAGTVATECFGIVGMAGIMKSGLVNLLKKDSMTRGITVSLTPNNKLVIDFHVIVSYGVNIPTVCEQSYFQCPVSRGGFHRTGDREDQYLCRGRQSDRLTALKKS
jgi:hypothetical protein